MPEALQPEANPESTPQKSSNELAHERTEFAKYRTREAADRTLMAWMRTSLSLISFGFGIPTLVAAIRQAGLGPPDPQRFSILIGLMFIVVGVVGLAGALKAHRSVLKAIRRGSFIYPSRDVDATQIAAVSLLVIGLVSFVAVWLEALQL